MSSTPALGTEANWVTLGYHCLSAQEEGSGKPLPETLFRKLNRFPPYSHPEFVRIQNQSALLDDDD